MVEYIQSCIQPTGVTHSRDRLLAPRALAARSRAGCRGEPERRSVVVEQENHARRPLGRDPSGSHHEPDGSRKGAGARCANQPPGPPCRQPNKPQGELITTTLVPVATTDCYDSGTQPPRVRCGRFRPINRLLSASTSRRTAIVTREFFGDVSRWSLPPPDRVIEAYRSRQRQQ
jgi:hypothetical protein